MATDAGEIRRHVWPIVQEMLNNTFTAPASGTPTSSNFFRGDKVWTVPPHVAVVGGTNTFTSGTLVFSNSNGLTFGINGSTLTGSIDATAVGALTHIRLSAGETSQLLSAVTFANSNGISFGLNASTMTATVKTDYLTTAAASNHSHGNPTLALTNLSGTTASASNGLTLSLSAGAPGGGATISSYENCVPFASQVTFTIVQSTSVAVAFNLPQAGSFSFIRIPVSMTTNSTTLSTAAASLSGSAAVYSTWNAVVYSLGVGANSRSLQSVASGSAGFTFMNSISAAANGTQYTISQFYSANAEGAGTTRTTQYSISNTNYSYTTNQIATEFSGLRFIDINFANSLSAGPYWLLYGYSTSTASNSARVSAATNCRVGASHCYGVSQPNLAFGIFGSTNFTSGGRLGAGSFTTAGGGTTASLPLSAITSSASNMRPYFQLLRSA